MAKHISSSHDGDAENSQHHITAYSKVISDYYDCVESALFFTWQIFPELIISVRKMTVFSCQLGEDGDKPSISHFD